MNKKRSAKLMQLADSVLEASGILQKDNGESFIQDSYNGQTEALGVTILMNGLLPALVIYYQQASESREIDRKRILEAIAKMINKDEEFGNREKINNAYTLLKEVMAAPANKALKKEVLECSTALKQVIRTYKLKQS